ncbi:large-conductance mechanosensitive channel [Plectosphaerella plurivora]|uniref:Large-conductance mechanosensitive channel n=1 Tax=Plectosphaerella plurivora TaxID=936078 RepID=A0A9P8VI04_9PEZI|nr:large-conductance mechanosensitive channel [Plectosphaerella plurivora]
MPRLGDSDDEDTILVATGQKARRVWTGFVDFAMQGNILEIAFGLILAAAFTTVVNSFVSNILLPPLSVIFPLDHNMEEKFAVLKKGNNYDEEEGYNTLARAKDDGAVVLAYGSFINTVISFFCVGMSLYGLAHFYQLFSSEPIIKHTTKCRYCKKLVSSSALRCVNCTSWLDGREDRIHR